MTINTNAWTVMVYCQWNISVFHRCCYRQKCPNCETCMAQYSKGKNVWIYHSEDHVSWLTQFNVTERFVWRENHWDWIPSLVDLMVKPYCPSSPAEAENKPVSDTESMCSFIGCTLIHLVSRALTQGPAVKWSGCMAGIDGRMRIMKQ